jgi:hypothetical protein
MPVVSATLEAISRRILSETDHGQKHKTLKKKKKRDGELRSMAQVVESLLSKHETLIFKPQYCHK